MEVLRYEVCQRLRARDVLALSGASRALRFLRDDFAVWDALLHRDFAADTRATAAQAWDAALCPQSVAVTQLSQREGQRRQRRPMAVYDAHAEERWHRSDASVDGGGSSAGALSDAESALVDSDRLPRYGRVDAAGRAQRASSAEENAAGVSARTQYLSLYVG